MSSPFVLEKKLTQKITAAVTPSLRPGETIEEVTFAMVGPSQAGTNVALGALTVTLGVLFGSTAFANSQRRMVFPVLTSQRLIFLDSSSTKQPLSTILTEVERSQIRAAAPKGIWNRTVALTTPAGEPFVELHYLFAQKADAAAIAGALA